jgi:hypothetical protein
VQRPRCDHNRILHLILWEQRGGLTAYNGTRGTPFQNAAPLSLHDHRVWSADKSGGDCFAGMHTNGKYCRHCPALAPNKTITKREHAPQPHCTVASQATGVPIPTRHRLYICRQTRHYLR